MASVAKRVLLERADGRDPSRGRKAGNVGVDRLLSSLKTLGIMESLPVEQADGALVELRDIEDVYEGDRLTDNEIRAGE